MKQLRSIAKWSVPVAMIGIGAFGPSITRADQVTKDTKIAALGYSTACADGDGSCGPAPTYVCGLNGKNYSEKVYLAPGDQ